MAKKKASKPKATKYVVKKDGKYWPSEAMKKQANCSTKQNRRSRSRNY